jgi:hypothetical protein
MSKKNDPLWGGLLTFNIEINFQGKPFKSVLNKLKNFIQYKATVGIHKADGKKLVVRRYTTMSKKGNSVGHYAGKSYRMTIAKLAYQNEFGATIRIKPKYRVATNKIKSEVNTLHHRITTTTIEKYSALRSAKQQGYLLLDKRGKYVAYFKPNSVITIPSRPFLRKVITNPTNMLSKNISDVLSRTFIKNGYSAAQSFKKIAQLVQVEVINNIVHNGKSNHPLTAKAKGKNDPLVDEKNRLAKAITYKLYKGQSGIDKYKNQKSVTYIDKALATIKQFENQGVISRETLDPVKKDFGDKINPRFEFKDYLN